MIHEVLAIVADDLNQLMRARLRLGEDVVTLSPPCEPDGTPAQRVEDRLALFIASVNDRPLAPPSATLVQPMRLLELSLVCAACHGSANYGEGLRLLEVAMSRLAARPLLTRQNCARLPAAIDRVEIAAENLSLADWQTLWRMHGGRYLPAMMYRVRLEMPAGLELATPVPTIEEPD